MIREVGSQIGVLYNKKTSIAREMSEREIGWVAGILEGEGCFSVLKNRSSKKIYLHAKVHIQSSDRDVVEKIQSFSGLGTVAGPFKTRSAKHSPMHSWQTQGDDARTLMNLILPQMGIRRKKKIKQVLETCR